MKVVIEVRGLTKVYRDTGVVANNILALMYMKVRSSASWAQMEPVKRR